MEVGTYGCGGNVANNLPNPDDNVAATGGKTARKAAGTSVYTGVKNVSGAASPNTKPVARKNTAAGDNAGPSGHRGQILAERLGPAFSVTVTMGKTVAPEAGATQANGRIVPATCGRPEGNFRAASNDSVR